MSAFLLPIHRHWKRIALVAALVALGLGAARWSPWRQADPKLTTPVLALAALDAKSLYYNAAARPWLLAQRVDLLTPDDRDARSERVRAFGQAVANEKLFRQLDRRDRFDTILLVGDPSQYRTLLDHLVETKDFTLAYLDHTSMVFKRGSAPAWMPKDLEKVRAQLGNFPAAAQAEFLALAAAKLVAAHRAGEAKPLLDDALALDRKSTEAWNALALYQVSRGEWTEALRAADRALSFDRMHLGALATKTQVFYVTKRYNEAYALSRSLVERLPNDPNVLFKHAQIAHEAHAYKAEIAALEKLIALAEAESRSTTGYRLYLAQAFMASSQGQPAIEQFTRVLADPELPDDQRKFSRESVDRIRKRTGL